MPPANPFPTGAPLETIAETGGPIALSPAPEGFLPYMAHDSPPFDPNELPPEAREHLPVQTPRWESAWVAFDGELPVSGRTLDLLVVELAEGTGVYDLADLDQSPEEQRGSLVGKVGYNPWDDRRSFAAALGPEHALLVTGRGIDPSTFDEVLAGLAIGANNTVEPTWLPTDLRNVYEGIATSHDSFDHQYSLWYFKDSMMEGGISVGLTVGPALPAEMGLLTDQGEVVQFDGRFGVRQDDRLVFDLSSGVQMTIAINWGYGGGGPPVVSSDYLIALARSVVALTSDEWASLQQYTSEHLLRPVDVPCSGGTITFSELVTDSPALEPLGEFAVFGPGATFNVTGTVERPTELTINARNPWDGTLIPLATALVDGPTPFTITWDGTINGAVAPPGYYTLQVTGTFTLDQYGNSCMPSDFEQGNLIKALYYIE